ncbi:MAG TPA: trypsin-like peptidase domain-containing protein, partial [Anaerolineales bacterium]|nr:trypsin-like peptidase domain-containing protein [Anaerolineales bacterium]
LSLTDDLALLYLKNGYDIPIVQIRDERRLRQGDPIFNVSFPLDAGKQVFHGEYINSRFPHLSKVITQEYTQWTESMPMNMTIGHGSSGSGVYSARYRGLVGVAVGTFGEGSFNIAIPSDRVLDFLNDLPDNTVTKFMAAFPVHDAPIEFF